MRRRQNVYRHGFVYLATGIQRKLDIRAWFIALNVVFCWSLDGVGVRNDYRTI